jgi:hypothetical protein
LPIHEKNGSDVVKAARAETDEEPLLLSVTPQQRRYGPAAIASRRWEVLAVAAVQVTLREHGHRVSEDLNGVVFA